jgi:hypothetical protein
MTIVFKRCALILSLVSLAVGSAFAQDTPPANPFAFKMGLDMGAQTFITEKPNDPDAGPFQFIGFSPDISFGKFGIGLDLTVNYTLNGPPGAPVPNSFYIRVSDWVPLDFKDFLALYLPRIAYVRWGEKGDPLFIKLGSFKDGTLGDGFIMGSYNNTLFMPTYRHLGLQADLDGGLFKFPFVGLETVIGNIAVMDVLGARLYVRPLIATQIPILNNLEVGVTAVADTGTNATTKSPATPVAVFGGDVQLPIVYVKNIVSMLAFTDVAFEGPSTGAMLGFGGKLLNLISYGAQLRYLGAGFQPGYFGVAYDNYENGRGKQFNNLPSASSTAYTFGWSASMGTSFLADKFLFLVKLDSPIITTEAPTSSLAMPHLVGILSMAEGVIPGITFDFIYDKQNINTWQSLFSLDNALMRAQLNFQTGGAVISFIYNITYDSSQPAGKQFVTQSGLQSSIPLF